MINEVYARSLVAQSRRNVGILLQSFQVMKKNPSNYTPEMKEITRRQLRNNLAVIKRLYRDHPEIKPERVEQLNLFTSRPKGWVAVREREPPSYIPESSPEEIFLSSLEGQCIY